MIFPIFRKNLQDTACRPGKKRRPNIFDTFAQSHYKYGPLSRKYGTYLYIMINIKIPDTAVLVIFRSVETIDCLTRVS